MYGARHVADDLSTAGVPPVDATDHLRGEGEAPVILYAEFTCPHCAVTYLRMREDGGALVFRHFALTARSPRAVALSRAAEAAAAQGAFWPFADALFADQGRQDDPHLWARCEALGLDLERFEADRRAPWTAERVQRSTRAALRAGVMGTPTVVPAPRPGSGSG